MFLKIKNTFTESLPADTETTNEVRKVFNACYSFVNPTKPSNPSLIHLNEKVANEVGINHTDLNSTEFLDIVSGNKILENSKPFAMCYGGHQFGHWAGQLGDGRAINLFELNNYTLQLKGAGKTPYSRTADGLAVLRSSIREYICAEAMHYLKIPTTRSLSLVLSGDQVLRDMLYNGNPAYEKGAIVCRVSPSFIRFGNFEIFASRNDKETLQKLADYTIKNHFPEIKSDGKQKYIDFFETIVNSTLEMIIHWQRVGFVHGVMNTDNMSIHGITIDYGPYGWLDNFDPNWTPNTTDNQHKRYRYSQQPEIALWNLYQLANAIYPLIEETKQLEKILNQYPIDFEKKYYNMMLRKIGLQNQTKNTTSLVNQLIQNLHFIETDFTIYFRLLSSILSTDTSSEALEKISLAFYNFDYLNEEVKTLWKNWFTNYLDEINTQNISDDERKKAMNLVNPKYIFKNYIAQMVIDEADKGNYGLLGEIFNLIQNPYDEQPEMEKWFAKRPDWAKEKIGCSQLSCSS